MFRRSWRGEQLRLVVSSVVLAVAVVTSVSILAERVERALISETSTFLAADLVLESNSPITKEWIELAATMGLQTSRMMSFMSMVYSGDEMHLASIKAVDNVYPLRGVLRHSDTAFVLDGPSIITGGSPQVGEAWVDGRLLPLLDIRLGDSIDFGEGSIEVTRILVEEPDSGGFSSMTGARVLMHEKDVFAAGVLIPGSRVKYRLLLAAHGADAANQLNKYRDLMSSKLSVHQRWISPDKAQAGISDTIEKAHRFLMLAGSIGVVLAGVALALASHQFARGEILQVGLYKTWGIRGSGIRKLYTQYAILVGVTGSFFGLVVGVIVQEIIIQLISDWLPVNLPPPSGKTWTIGFFTGILCLSGFMMPALWHLPALSALSVLRKDVKVKPLGLAYRGIIGVVTIGCLLWYYSASLMVALAIFSAFVVITLATFILGYALLLLGKAVSQKFGSVWRLAFANLWRRRAQSLLQVLGFSGAISLLMVMMTIRTSLIDEWQWQLAADTPNHFFINVAPHELEGVESLMSSRSLENVGWYSMVRARIRAFNGQDLTSEQRDKHESLRRELNLSWSDKLPEGNEIVSGSWWSEAPANDDSRADKIIPVSIEVDVADELGLTLGDLVTFSVGGLEFEARMANTRSVNWQKMTPNFYFLFPKDVLLQFPHTNMTSVYIPSEEKGILNRLLRDFPTLQVIELDKVIKRIRSIVSQVTRGLEVMTVLILTCGVLVMFTSVRLSMSERLHESAVLRTLGSSRSVILGIQIIEFASIGLISGLLAVIGAETSLALIKYFVFNLPPALHYPLWSIGPLFCMVTVGALGVGYAKSAVIDSPLDLLRRL